MWCSVACCDDAGRRSGCKKACRSASGSEKRKAEPQGIEAVKGGKEGASQPGKSSKVEREVKSGRSRALQGGTEPAARGSQRAESVANWEPGGSGKTALLS